MNCGNCLHFDKTPGTEPGRQRHRCLRHAPRMLGEVTTLPGHMQQETRNAVWPLVLANDRCGE